MMQSSGMSLLLKLPIISDILQVPMQAFEPNSRSKFDATIKKVEQHYNKIGNNFGAADVIESWKNWDLSFIPQNDNVMDYVIR